MNLEKFRRFRMIRMIEQILDVLKFGYFKMQYRIYYSPFTIHRPWKKTSKI